MEKKTKSIKLGYISVHAENSKRYLVHALPDMELIALIILEDIETKVIPKKIAYTAEIWDEINIVSQLLYEEGELSHIDHEMSVEFTFKS